MPSACALTVANFPADDVAFSETIRPNRVYRHHHLTKGERLGECVGFSAICSRADGRRERVSLEATQPPPRCPALLHADASLLGLL